MNATMLDEIMQIPDAAYHCLEQNKGLKLPRRVYYLGMGSSYFAPLALKYAGCDILAEVSSEYFHYLSALLPEDEGVLLSQSGRSSETLWCRDLFRKYTAITNDAGSHLANGDNLEQTVLLHAGEEQFSSSKTYINMLLVLYHGLGYDTMPALEFLRKNMDEFEKTGKEWSEMVYDHLKVSTGKGIYIIGSGPNIGTAMEASLILTESTRLPFHGIPMAQYDHGPKESAMDSLVFSVLQDGPSWHRTKALHTLISKSGGKVIDYGCQPLDELISPIVNIMPFHFMCYYLSAKMGIQEPFTVGGKVTQLDLDQT
jgi:glutamine---fructose-6-phosphate transaminase (isomerizing)